MNSKKIQILILTTVIILVICLLPHFVSAQGGPPCTDPDDPACPIDGGLSLLVAAGVGYGVKKYREKRV